MGDRHNPYAAPQVDELHHPTFEAEPQLSDATQGARLGNFFLDSIFRQAAAFGPVLLAGSHSPVLNVVLILLGLFGYYAIFESLTGRTPAKYLTRTRVVDMTGGKPSLGQILTRSAARFIPFEPFSFLGSSHRGWHDTLSRTRVVRA